MHVAEWRSVPRVVHRSFHVVLPNVRWINVIWPSLGPLPFASALFFFSSSLCLVTFATFSSIFLVFFGLALRRCAPVFLCHREAVAMQEAGTCGGSRAWRNYSSSLFSLWDFARFFVFAVLYRSALNCDSRCVICVYNIWFFHCESTMAFTEICFRVCIRDTLVNVRT